MEKKVVLRERTCFVKYDKEDKCVKIYKNASQVLKDHVIKKHTFYSSVVNKNYIEGYKFVKVKYFVNIAGVSKFPTIIDIGKEGLEGFTERLPTKEKKRVYFYNKQELYIGEYESISLASLALQIPVRKISDVANGRRPHYKGYIFKFNYVYK